ncbi:MAG: DUF1553 domain-containing protein [Planctomycetota bacterium]
MKILLTLPLLFLGLTFIEPLQVSAEEQIDFNRDIRPILADKCFQCHGPDEADRAADLRLDEEASAQDFAFVPGDVENSEGWLRIISTDPEEVMPPPEIHKDLEPAEKELIKKWIQSGAKFEVHWSFQKIASPKKPTVDDPRFARTAIDSFVYQRMRSQGLHPSPPATKEALIRRVTLDLTGLPPTLEEVEAFVADQSPDAYEKVVNRLLASPAFGERMAVDWLDLARYGDTSVFHADGPRDMWRWRDWVVDAYNQNMPFDQFTVRQLAGDLLPNATLEDQIASGFNRNNASTDEGGAIAEEFRVEYAVDRVKTTSMVWMGLSMECAQCHDHKYDPISQEDYYRFFAFFNQAADPGMQTRRGNQSPIVNVMDEAKLAQVPTIQSKMDGLTEELEQLKQDQKPASLQWLANPEIVGDKSPIPEDMSSFFTFDAGAKNKIVNQTNPDDKIKTVGKTKFPEGKFGKAIQTRGNEYLSSETTAANFAGDTAISFGCWVKLSGAQNGAAIARMDEGNSHVGFDLYLQNNGVGAHFIHKWPSDAIKVIADKKLEKNQWYHLFITYDGSKSVKGIRVYVNGELLPAKPSHDQLTGSTQTKTPFTVGRRKNSSQFNGLVDDVRVYDRELTSSEVGMIAEADPLPGLLAVAPEERTDQQKDELFKIFLERQVPRYGELNREIASLEARKKQLQKPITSVMVMKDLDKPRMTYVLDRGQYDSPNKEKPVEAGVPEFLPEFGEKYQQNRLGMAQWLTSPDHPLTSRVTVNRIWQMFFGTGIVESVEDFGLQGTWPSHRGLLDWLASDFVQNGWNTKHLVKMIVLSETYRQSSVVTNDQLELDPGNRLLSRSSRFRLPGEFLRDQALALSGLLNPEIGGPGVKPYQPDGLWNEVSLNGGLRFKRDTGAKLYRRSIYTYWKRSSPPPNITLFDAPTREKCIVRRGKTNTPLQALVLMNDPQYVESAKFFASRIIKEGGKTVRDKIKFAFKTAVAKEPSKEVVDVLENLHQQELSTFQEEIERAKGLLSIGEKAIDEGLDKAELAAWTIVSNLIFNLDEFVTRG